MKRRVKVFISLFLSIVFFSIPLMGCNKNNEENVINVYTGLEEEYVSAYIKAFNEKYPEVKVNIIRDSTGVVSAKLAVEKDNPRCDVMWGINSSNVLFLDKYGLFSGYAPENLKNINEKYYDTSNDLPHWMAISIATVAFTVNVTELEKQGLPSPTSYEDLLNPIYKGKIIMPNPTSSGTGLSILSSLNQIYGEEEYWQYLNQLNKNIGQYAHSGSAPTKQTAQGEYVIGIGMDFLSIQMEKDNPHIKTVYPKEGSGWDVEISALINKDNIKDGAKKFYEWMVSEDAMELYAQNRSLVTSNNEKYVKPEFKQSIGSMIDNDLIWQSDNRKRLTNEWDKKYGVGE